MKRTAVVAAFVVFLTVSSVASAATVYVDITTNKSLYAPGELVSWTLYAWSSVPVDEPPHILVYGTDGKPTNPDNHGISLLKVDLSEDKGETLSPALYTNLPPPELTGTTYGVANGFALDSRGVATVTPGGLVDIDVHQTPGFASYDIGNDGVMHVYAKGTFTANVLGLHTLSAIIQTAGANYWPDHTEGHLPVAFENAVSGDTQFTVSNVPEPATLVLLGLGGVALLRRRR